LRDGRFDRTDPWGVQDRRSHQGSGGPPIASVQSGCWRRKQWASSRRNGRHEALIDACTQTASRATDLGLTVNIGHDLNLDNLPSLVAALPVVAEASIGHELVADALVMGFGSAVAAYKAALTKLSGAKPE